MVKKLFFTFLVFFSLLFNATICQKTSIASVIYPQKYGSEGRFKSWLYHPNGIYHFTGHYMNPTYIEFNAKEKKILENVKVIDVNGNDIMRRDLLLELH